MIEWVLVIVASQWTDYAACNAQVPHEQAYLDQIEGDYVATCIAVRYAPPVTIRPVARKVTE